MRIFLDTNILVSNYPLDSPALRGLLEGCRTAGFSLFISKLVLDETITKFYEDYEKRRNKILAMGIEKVSSIDSFKLPSPEEASASYKTFLQENLLSNATVLNYPNVPHETLVARALQRKKPFRVSDTGGYRDALLWHTILSILENKGDAVALITQNVNDFGAKDQRGKLSEDLLAELTELNLGGQVLLFTSLSDFVNAEITPKLEVLQKLRDELAIGAREELNLERFLLDDFIQLIGVNEWLGTELGLEPAYDASYIIGLTYIDSIEEVDVRKLSGDDVLVTFWTVAEAEVETYVEKEEIHKPRWSDWELDEDDPDGSYQIVTISPYLALKVSVVINVSTWNVISATLDKINPRRTLHTRR